MKEQSYPKVYSYSVYSILFMCSVFSATQGVFLTGFINQFHLESSAQGLMGSFQSLGSLMALLVAAFLAGRMKKSTIMTLFFGLILLVSAFLGTVTIFSLLLLSFGLFGFFFGFIDTTGSSVMADIHTGRDADKYMNMLHGVFGVGGLIAPPVLSFLGRGLNWNQLYLIIAGVMLLFFILNLVISRICVPQLQNMKKEEVKKLNKADLLAFFKNKSCVLILLALFFNGAQQQGMNNWVTRYVSDFLKAPEFGALALSLFWVGTACARFFVPRLPLTPVQVVLFGNIGTALAILIGVLSGNGLVVTICALLSGFLQGASLPMIITMGCRRSPGNTLMASTLLFLGMFIAYSLVGIVIATVADWLNLSAGMAVCSVCSLIAAALILPLRREENKTA